MNTISTIATLNLSLRNLAAAIAPQQKLAAMAPDERKAYHFDPVFLETLLGRQARWKAELQEAKREQQDRTATTGQAPRGNNRDQGDQVRPGRPNCESVEASPAGTCSISRQHVPVCSSPIPDVVYDDWLPVLGAMVIGVYCAIRRLSERQETVRVQDLQSTCLVHGQTLTLICRKLAVCGLVGLSDPVAQGGTCITPLPLPLVVTRGTPVLFGSARLLQESSRG